MRAIISSLIVCGLLVSGGRLFGQVSGTNKISQTQAIEIASRLRVGMREEDVRQFLATNNLHSSLSVGASIGWGACYTLSNGCSLVLDYSAREVRTNGLWGGNGRLERAFIQSNYVNIISITLTNAP